MLKGHAMIDNWQHLLWRLWSARVALALILLNAALIGLGAFESVMRPWLYLTLNMIGWPIVLVARLVKQPGADA